MEILDAFEFLDSHAHAFFMDNIAWSQKKAYYVDYIEDAPHYSKDFTVGQVIKDKQKFKYVFDFGTEWVFQCRVLKILDEPYTEEYGEVIRSKGEAPNQYGFDLDDEDFDFGFDVGDFDFDDEE